MDWQSLFFCLFILVKRGRDSSGQCQSSEPSKVESVWTSSIVCQSELTRRKSFNRELLNWNHQEVIIIGDVVQNYATFAGENGVYSLLWFRTYWCDNLEKIDSAGK